MINSPVKRKSLSEEVALKIRNHIISNALKAGDRLPTEQEMADSFGVSRISVREATKALNFFGVIDAAPRRGLRVGSVNMQRVAEVLGFHFALDNYPRELLLKARLVIEIGSLQYAMEAMAANPALYQQLSDMCRQLENTEDPDSFIQQDAAFHHALVQASGIEPLVAFDDVLQVFFARFRDKVIKIKKGWVAGAGVHQQIIDALRGRDLIGAESLLRKHLELYNESE
jgi:GntR family transcriptional regulator, transcriptional repressor for pyruvate dehydrogenase complex